MPRSPPKDHRTPDEIDADKRLLDKLTTKGTKIMPVSIKKYIGSIKALHGALRWQSLFQGQYKHICARSHDTMEQAITRIKDETKKRTWPVKNVIYEYKGQYYCLLTQGKIMKFSYEHIGVVEKHIWCAVYNPGTKSFYATTAQNGVRKSYPQITFPDMKDNEVGDHANGDSLDNNIENIRVVAMSVQCRNKRKFSNNTSGTTGVYYMHEYNRGDRWVAYWVENGKPRTKSFSINKYGDQAKSNATDLRKKKEKSLASYSEALSHRSG